MQRNSKLLNALVAGRKRVGVPDRWAHMTDAWGPSGTGSPIRLFSYARSLSGATPQAMYARMSSGSVLVSEGYEVNAQVAHAHDLVHHICCAR